MTAPAPASSAAGFTALPAIIPVFPLDGALLLPRGQLPLNIFEPRYLAMVKDAMAADRVIGMIQPRPPGKPEPVRLYDVGCAGRITSFTETGDGRNLITLTGLCRFAVGKEWPLLHGYRRVEADYSRFANDLVEEDLTVIDRDRVVTALRNYFRLRGIPVPAGLLEKQLSEPLIAALAMACPFESSEKQALLECPGLAERCDTMIALIEMALYDPPGPPSQSRQ